MPKQTKRAEREQRELTRKQHAIRRRDIEKNRRITMGLVAVAVLLVGLVGAGVVQELVIKPRQPVATVNGAPIGRQDYTDYVRFAWLQESQGGQPIQDPQGSSIQVLDQMIDDELVVQEAQKRGITVSEDEIDQAIEKNFGYYRQTPTPAPTSTPSPTPSVQPTASATPAGTATPSPTPAPTATPVTLEAYQKLFATRISEFDKLAGINQADYRRLVKTSLLQQKLYEQVSANVATKEEQVRVRHILVSIRTPEPTPAPTATGLPTPAPTPTGLPTPAPTPTPAPPRDDAQALARVIEVQQKIGAGEDFAKLAQQYSDDPGSAAEGGEIGWFGRDQGYDKAFEDGAFALQKPGEVSQPVKSQFGYHLIQLEERDPSRPLDAYLLEQRKYEGWTTFMGQLRQQAKIERNWSADLLPALPGQSGG